ncbi:MAG: hypothetical protein K6G73_05475 [Marinilabiliaceae bacterium]|nr:hypothetical protein [Bacteroidales bacterium]MCR5696412.1 hypothetical protein [Marinilabiliaceae bacterium]
MNKIQITENEVHDRIFYRKKHKNKELNNALYEKYQSIHDDTGKEDKDKYVSEIFNLAYTIYDNLSKEQDFPEDTVDDLYDMVQKKYNEAHPFCDIVDEYYDPLKEYISIVFVFAYVILNNSGCSYEELPCAMNKIERIIDDDYFEEFKLLLKKERNTSNEPSSEENRGMQIIASTDAIILSFTYAKLATNQDNITYLMDRLKDNGFIDKGTKAVDFKRVFSGKEVKNPIRWTTYLGGLLDLFRQLNKNKLIKFEGNNMYKIVCSCFIDTDGNAISEEKLRNCKISKSINPLISKAVNLMK